MFQKSITNQIANDANSLLEKDAKMLPKCPNIGFKMNKKQTHHRIQINATQRSNNDGTKSETLEQQGSINRKRLEIGCHKVVRLIFFGRARRDARAPLRLWSLAGLEGSSGTPGPLEWGRRIQSLTRISVAILAQVLTRRLVLEVAICQSRKALKLSAVLSCITLQSL